MDSGNQVSTGTGVGPAHLIALDTSLQYSEYEIDSGGCRIGRNARLCDIVLSGPTVSREHCAITRVDAGSYSIHDANSTNGVFVNGRRIVNEQRLEPGDVIGIGTAEIGHFRFQLESQRGRPRISTLPPKSEWLIGRNVTNDISLPFESMTSAKHAVIRRRPHGLEVVDQKSLNGTWVNGIRVRRAGIDSTDSVIIGSTIFQFNLLEAGGLQVSRRETGSRFELECVDLAKEVRRGVSREDTKRILDKVSLAIKPGEFVGLLGPSGAGKSTLLKTLNGYSPPTHGCVLVNQSPLYQSFEMFRSAIGYVPQDDIIHSELTVEDSLNYIAELRLPPDVTVQQRHDLVDTTIESLGLSYVRTNRIDELSGGQRKRVSIGAELITRPSILFLDEPTSGMDPSTEEKLMHRFKEMASRGTTVLITTHILYNLNLLDRIVILARGRLVFFGTPDEAMTFFGSSDAPLQRPTQIFELLEGEEAGTNSGTGGAGGIDKEQIAHTYETKYRESELYRRHVLSDYSNIAGDLYSISDGGAITNQTQNKTTLSRYQNLLEKPTHTRKRGFNLKIFGLDSLRILARRVARIKLVSMKRAAFYLAVPAILALVTLSLHTGSYPNDRAMALEKGSIQQQVQAGPVGFGRALKILLSPAGADDARPASEVVYSLKYEGVANLPISMSVLLMFVMTAVFTGTLMSCMDISGERPVYRRERMAGLKIGDYLVSKLPFLFALTAVQCLVFLAICMVKPELRHLDFVSAYVALVAMAWTSCAIGLFLSAADPTPGQFSIVLAIVAVLPQLVLSGGLAPDFFRGMSPAVKVIGDLLPAKWGLEMLMTSFFRQPSIHSLDWVAGFVKNKVGFEFGSRVILINAGVLMIQGAAWLGAAAFLLKRQDSVR